MKASSDIENRKPVWIALSEFYLDTELEDVDFKLIAEVFFKSPYTFDEIKQINKYEVFPLLQPNLLSVAGVWGGFDEQWLTTKLAKRFKKRNLIRKIAINLPYFAFKGMCSEYWAKVEQEYKKLTTAQQ